MSKFEEVMEKVNAEVKSSGVKVNSNLLVSVAKSLGPSIYNLDASLVSCSQESELETVKNNYLIKKLGLEDSPKLDAAIKEVCEALGSANRNKIRVIFYAMLAEKFGKEGMYK